MRQPLSLAPILTALLFPILYVQACGPFFADDVFVRTLRPDHPKLFAAGKLGVLLPTYPRADLTVAYRYLNGGTLTAEEQKAYQPTISMIESEGEDRSNDAELGITYNYESHVEPPGAADEWLAARNKFAAPQPKVHSVWDKEHGIAPVHVLAGNYENCQPESFRTAISTLESRAKSWGAKSPELADWIKAQDAVFSNCSGLHSFNYYDDKANLKPSNPEPAPTNAPLLLRQDRAYQQAAALFYAAQASQSTQARIAFQAIAADHDSPWHGIAAYLVARSLIREAYLTAAPVINSGDYTATFTPALMQQAQHQLESLRKEKPTGISPQAVDLLLNLVRLRTEPEARLHEIAEALSSPKPDPNYDNDLKDLVWYLNGKLDSIAIRGDVDDSTFNVKRPDGDSTPLAAEEKRPGFNKAFSDVAKLRATAPLVDWLITVQSPAEDARKHAIREWQQSRSLPWLVAALTKATGSEPAAPELLAAAAVVPTTSPAWPSLSYHRIRILKELGRTQEARAELATALPLIQAGSSKSAENLFAALQMQSATTLDEALTHAPRQILNRVSTEQSSVYECLDVMKDPKRKYDCKDPKSPLEFSKDSAALFNTQMPLTTLAQAAHSTTLPQPLRQSLAIMTWVRAVLLHNDTIAAQMLPLLPAKLQQQAGPGTGFHQQLVLLRNPGLRPYLDPGIQRSYSYDFVESFADNWWCPDWNTPAAQPQSTAYLDAATRAKAQKELDTLQALRSADKALGSQVLAYANAHPADPEVPEALYLTLRMIRYSCNHDFDPAEKLTPPALTPTQIAHNVVALMRRRYIASQWTKKAAPFVYLGTGQSN